MKGKKVDFLATPMGGDDLHADSINGTDLQGMWGLVNEPSRWSSQISQLGEEYFSKVLQSASNIYQLDQFRLTEKIHES